MRRIENLKSRFRLSVPQGTYQPLHFGAEIQLRAFWDTGMKARFRRDGNCYAEGSLRGVRRQPLLFTKVGSYRFEIPQHLIHQASKAISGTIEAFQILPVIFDRRLVRRK